MGEIDERDQTRKEPCVLPGKNAFSCAFYIFGMVMTAPIFAYFALRMSDPSWGGQFRQGWIDPSLNLIVMPVIGGIIGFLLVLAVNLAYIVYRKKTQGLGKETDSTPC